MNISSNPMSSQAGGLADLLPLSPANSNPQTTAANAAQPSDNASSPASAPDSPDFSTDMRVDKQHQIYYAIIDNYTGNELVEIPPEALRVIAESLNLPVGSESAASTIDVET
jgi:hypothetical protein